MYVAQNLKFLEQSEDIKVQAETNTKEGRDIQVQAATNTNTLISATVALENEKSEDNQHMMITFLEIIAPMMMMMKSLIIMMILMQNCLAFN